MTDFPDKWKERTILKPSYSWIEFYANAVKKTTAQRNFFLPINLQFKDLYAVAMVKVSAFLQGSEMDSEVLIKPLQNIMCLPQIPE